MKWYIVKKSSLVAVFALLFIYIVRAQEYAYPVENVAGLYAASFGEMRPAHFHGGIDIKTDGQIGRPLVAMEDGYICRVSISPSGYGKAIYIKYPGKGTMSVYGHLNSYRDDIDSLVNNYRIEHRKNRVNLTFDENDLPVRRGEVVAYSGNTGHSFGPHLHLELRDIHGKWTSNVIKRGVLEASDDIAPKIINLHYVAVDTLLGVPQSRCMWSVSVVKKKDHYEIREKDLPVTKYGYFVVETRDSKNKVSNRFGIYSARLFVDGKQWFEYRMDGFPLSESKYCDAVSYYPLQKKANAEVIRMVRLQNCPKYFYKVLCNDGLVTTPQGAKHSLKIEVEDDSDNTSLLLFDVVNRGTIKFNPVVDDAWVVGKGIRPYVEADLWFTISESSLYEPLFVKFPASEYLRKLSGNKNLRVLSKVYTVGDSSVPLKGNITMQFIYKWPLWKKNHLAVASVDDKNRLSYVKSFYSCGGVFAQTGSFGRYVLVEDTEAPKVVVSAKNKIIVSPEDLRIKITDNFSSIKSVDCYVNGKWTPVNYWSMHSNADIVPTFEESDTYSIRFVVEDHCQNTADVSYLIENGCIK